MRTDTRITFDDLHAAATWLADNDRCDSVLAVDGHEASFADFEDAETVQDVEGVLAIIATR